MHPHFTLILCHHNADPDAICSAYAFSQLLRRLRPGLHVETAAAQGVSKLSKHVMKTIPLKLTSNPAIEKADILFIIDTNTLQQLDDWKPRIEKSKKPLIVVDHHAPHPETERIATLCIANEKSSSTCEIIHDLFREAHIRPSRREALALFLGIACDSRHFTLASSKTFQTVAELINAGVRAEEALPLLSVPMETSERVARLKAARRAEIVKIGDWLIGVSHVTAFQASAARALTTLGVHVAIVGGEKEGKLQMSLRASSTFYKKTGFHLGRDLAKPLGQYLHGTGGGHATSAGVNGEGELGAALKRALRLLQEKLKS